MSVTTSTAVVDARRLLNDVETEGRAFGKDLARAAMELFGSRLTPEQAVHVATAAVATIKRHSRLKRSLGVPSFVIDAWCKAAFAELQRKLAGCGVTD